MKTPLLVVLTSLCSLASTQPAVAGAPDRAQAPGQVTVVQAVPGSAVSVRIDDRSVRKDSRVGSLLGPFALSPGRHVLTFSGLSGAGDVRSTLVVRPNSSTDVVLHLPAAVGGVPVVNSYRTPRSPIGPGKARLLLAHTATVAPADVRFDGRTVFTDIANGEFAEADVPAGLHRVALLPTGQHRNPILGPLEVRLAARTVTMVYAVGNPTNRSMDVIAHTLSLPADGTSAPRTIDTGSAGLAADVRVTPFSTAAPRPADPSPGESPVWPLVIAAAVLLVLLAARRRPPAGGPQGRPRAERHER